jgi:hypothetical protein
MSDTLSFAELEAQHVELLPARTVLSLISIVGTPKGPGADGTATPGRGSSTPYPSFCSLALNHCSSTVGGATAGLGGSASHG